MRAVAKGLDDQRDALLKHLARQVQTDATTLRVMSGMMFRTFIMPTDHHIPARAMAAGKDYAKRAKEQGKDHQLGAPQHHVWAAAVVQATQAKSAGVAKCKHGGNEHEALQVLRQHVADVNAPKDLGEAVVQCRVTECHDKATVRIQIAVDQSLQLQFEALRAVLMREGAQEKKGTPPPTHNEREIKRLSTLLYPRQ